MKDLEDRVKWVQKCEFCETAIDHWNRLYTPFIADSPRAGFFAKLSGP
jgi:hypothetical protein